MSITYKQSQSTSIPVKITSGETLIRHIHEYVMVLLLIGREGGREGEREGEIKCMYIIFLTLHSFDSSAHSSNYNNKVKINNY